MSDVTTTVWGETTPIRAAVMAQIEGESWYWIEPMSLEMLEEAGDERDEYVVFVGDLAITGARRHLAEITKDPARGASL